MVAAVLLLLCGCSATDSNPCSELNGGSLKRSTCEALWAGFTSVDCCGAAQDPYTPPPPPIATATRSCVRSIGPGGTHRFWLPYLLSVAILLQAWPLATRPCARLGACSRTRSLQFTASPLLPPQVCREWFGRAPEPHLRMHWARAAKPQLSRTEATPKVGRLVLGLFLALAHKASAFTDTSSLAGALHEWCADASGAQATHGHISSWDVRAVTDLTRLVYSAPCRNTFDEDINAWDVGRVTSMDVRCRLFSGGGDGVIGPAWLEPHLHSWSGARSDGVRAGSQAMFYGAGSFNQPVSAWNVGKVTSMWVRRRPSRGLEGQARGVALSARAVAYSGELVRFARRRLCSTTREGSISP